MRFTSSLVLPYDTDYDTRSKNYCCEYCGSTLSITRDHVIPISWSGLKRNYSVGDTVKCCMECNSMLGAKPLFCITGRASFLIGEVSKKYKNSLSTPDWSEDDLNDLSYSLRKKVISSIKERDFIKARLANLVISANDGDKNYICKQVNPIDKKCIMVFQSPLAGMSIKDIETSFDVTCKVIVSMCRSAKYAGIRNKFLYDFGYNMDLDIYGHTKKIRDKINDK